MDVIVSDFLSWGLLYESSVSAAYRNNSKALVAGGRFIYKYTRSDVYKPEGNRNGRLASSRDDGAPPALSPACFLRFGFCQATEACSPAM